jgi:hypothetical protein
MHSFLWPRGDIGNAGAGIQMPHLWRSGDPEVFLQHVVEGVHAAI